MLLRDQLISQNTLAAAQKPTHRRLHAALLCPHGWTFWTCRVAVVMGVSERRKGGRTCYNATVAYDKDGTLLGVHRKILPTYAERYVWGRGDGSGLIAWDTSSARIGSLICWEHTMNLARCIHVYTLI